MARRTSQTHISCSGLRKIKKMEEKKPVWIACRATPNCQGDQAIIAKQWKNQVQGNQGLNFDVGSQTVRYKCLTCGRVFQIQT